MEEQDKTGTTKKPWPSRLANSSLELVIVGIIVCVLGIILSNAGGGAVLVLGFGLITTAFLFSIFSFIGLISHKFKSPGTGKVILVVLLSYPVFALVFAIVSPALFHAKTQAHKIQCRSNLKMLAIACYGYHTDDDKQWPLNNWTEALKPYHEDDKTLKCSKDKIGPCSYAMNENIPNDAKELPGDLVLLFESAPGWNQVGGADDVITDRHGKPGANIAFADGHVEFIKPEDIPALCWAIESQ
jgi:prepilin-type processing-associated H-X9-DG protein